MQLQTFSRARKILGIRILPRAPTLQTYLFWPIGVLQRCWLARYCPVTLLHRRHRGVQYGRVHEKKFGYGSYVGSLVAVLCPFTVSSLMRSGGSWSLLGRHAAVKMVNFSRAKKPAKCDLDTRLRANRWCRARGALGVRLGRMSVTATRFARVGI